MSRLAITLFVLIITAIGSRAAVTDVSMKRTNSPQFPKCPVYQVTFFSSGTLEYIGIENVKRLGTYRLYATGNYLSEIRGALLNLHFADLENEYMDPESDSPVVEISAVIDGTRKMVRHEALLGPTFLWAIERMIDLNVEEIYYNSYGYFKYDATERNKFEYARGEQLFSGKNRILRFEYGVSSWVPKSGGWGMGMTFNKDGTMVYTNSSTGWKVGWVPKGAVCLVSQFMAEEDVFKYDDFYDDHDAYRNGFLTVHNGTVEKAMRDMYAAPSELRLTWDLITTLLNDVTWGPPPFLNAVKVNSWLAYE